LYLDDVVDDDDDDDDDNDVANDYSFLGKSANYEHEKAMLSKLKTG